MALTFDSARLHNPYLTEEHEAWRHQLRRFLEAEVVPFLDDWEESGEIPDSLWPKAAEIGLLQLGYPEAYGGLSEGIDAWYSNITNEELTRAGSAGGLASNLLIHGIGLPPVAHFASEAIKQQVIPPIMAGEKRIALGITEPSGGSDVANITTTARRDGDHYIVNGSKTFISGAMKADWISAAVRTGGEGGRGVCLEEAVEWAQQRKTFGKRLADHQVIRHKIATMKQKINATQAYINYVTQAHIENRLSPGDLALAKVQASETMEYCTREASQILGGACYLRGNRVERFYREVRVNAIGGGSEEIMRDLAVRQYQL